eukprot:superscaffoldBa00016265_g26816
MGFCGKPTVGLPTESPHGLPCGIARAGPTAVLPFGATMRVSRVIANVGLPTECRQRPHCGIVRAGPKAVNQK